MLKKAGIIVAAVATGVLAVSSVAFADVSKGNLGNDCAFGNQGADAAQTLDGGSGLIGGVLGAITGTATNLTTQANTGNCTNVNTSDIIDSASNNKSKSWEKTMIEDSYNTEG